MAVSSQKMYRQSVAWLRKLVRPVAVVATQKACCPFRVY